MSAEDHDIKITQFHGRKLLGWLKKADGSIVRIFSDKKLWTVDRKRNARNDRWLAYHVEEVPPINCTKEGFGFGQV